MAADKILGSVYVTLPGTEGRSVSFNPAYFMDILKGVGDKGLAIYVDSPISPMRVATLTDPERVAVLMPTRRGTTEPDPRFDLSEFVEVVEVVAEPEPVKSKRRKVEA